MVHFARRWKKIVEQLKNLNELAARELGHEMHWAFVGCIFASVFGTIRLGPFAQAVVRQMNDLEHFPHQVFS